MAQLKDTTIDGGLVVTGNIESPTIDLLLQNLSNPNLLINGDFRVNQRGQTVYEAPTGAATYTVDRWFISNKRKITVNDGYITLESTIDGSTAYINQRIEGLKWGDGKAYTVSANIDGQVKTMTLINDGTAHSKVFEDGIGLAFGLATGMTDIITISVGYEAGGTGINIYWVKLEQGSVATPFVPRPYAEELAICQRYYVKLLGNFGGGNINGKYVYVSVATPTSLRIAPTISHQSCLIELNGVDDRNVSSLQNMTLSNNSIYLLVTLSSEFASNVLGHYGHFSTSSVLELDAEIY